MLLPSSTWMLITSPYGLWKEALAQGTICLLTGLLAAPSPGWWQRCGVLGQQQGRTPSHCVVTSADDDLVAQLSSATVRCRGNTDGRALPGSSLLPVLLCPGFPGPELDPRASSLELLGFCSVPGLGCGGGGGAAGTPALSSHWGLQPGRTS